MDQELQRTIKHFSHYKTKSVSTSTRLNVPLSASREQLRPGTSQYRYMAHTTPSPDSTRAHASSSSPDLTRGSTNNQITFSDSDSENGLTSHSKSRLSHRFSPRTKIHLNGSRTKASTFESRRMGLSTLEVPIRPIHSMRSTMRMINAREEVSA